MAVNVHDISHVECFSDGRKNKDHLRFDIELWCRENIGPKYFIDTNHIVFDCDEEAESMGIQHNSNVPLPSPGGSTFDS